MIHIAIPSRGRPKNVAQMQQLFPVCTWYVAESEANDYRFAGAQNIVTHPEDVLGSGKKTQWILDNTSGPVFIVDDDCGYVWVNVGRRGRRVDDPQAILQIVENACQCAMDVGISYFGFSNSWDVRKYNSNEPFTLNKMVRGAIGFTSRSLRYERGLFFRNNPNFALHVLATERIIWKDNRFAFVYEQNDNVGGLSIDRTREKDEAEMRTIAREWGQAVRFTRVKSCWSVSIDVPRRQQLAL